MAERVQILLNDIDAPDLRTMAGYEQRGGYKTMPKVMQLDPLKVVEEVKSSGLRGRGGAGFPTGVKWGFVPRNSGKPVYLLNNADESEPGTFKDRILLERNPHMVIEGMLIAAWALQSNWSCIYIRGEYGYPYACAAEAIKEAYKKGYLGKNIFGSNFSHDMVIHRGAGAYICGEESALIESLEGKKGQPRLRPPFPAIQGVYDCPTVVNNVETLANLPWIMTHGAEAFAAIGTKAAAPGGKRSTGTKLWSVSGHVNKPGIYEIEMGYPLLDMINNECGGVLGNRRIKAVMPGGSSFPVLTETELKGVNLDFESLAAAGSSVGSGGFVVMDETTDMVDVALNIAHFYAHESCGQCTPCREGGHWIEKIFKRIAYGHGLPGDIELINSVASNVEGHTICAFGEALAWPAKCFIKKFKDEFAARIEDAIEGRKRQTEPLNFEHQGAH